MTTPNTPSLESNFTLEENLFASEVYNSCLELSILGFASIDQVTIDKLQSLIENSTKQGFTLLANLLSELVIALQNYQRLSIEDNAQVIVTLISKVVFCLSFIVKTPNTEHALNDFLTDKKQLEFGLNTVQKLLNS